MVFAHLFIYVFFFCSSCGVSIFLIVGADVASITRGIKKNDGRGSCGGNGFWPPFNVEDVSDKGPKGRFEKYFTIEHILALRFSPFLSHA